MTFQEFINIMNIFGMGYFSALGIMYLSQHLKFI